MNDCFTTVKQKSQHMAETLSKDIQHKLNATV